MGTGRNHLAVGSRFRTINLEPRVPNQGRNSAQRAQTAAFDFSAQSYFFLLLRFPQQPVADS
jgi:hypothetical protein